MMLEIFLVQTFVKLGIKGVKLGEFFCLSQNNIFIPHPEPRQLLFDRDTRIGKHLEVFNRHLGPSIISNNALLKLKYIN
jgi:hypothetical protein